MVRARDHDGIHFGVLCQQVEVVLVRLHFAVAALAVLEARDHRLGRVAAAGIDVANGHAVGILERGWHQLFPAAAGADEGDRGSLVRTAERAGVTVTERGLGRGLQEVAAGCTAHGGIPFG